MITLDPDHSDIAVELLLVIVRRLPQHVECPVENVETDEDAWEQVAGDLVQTPGTVSAYCCFRKKSLLFTLRI